MEKSHKVELGNSRGRVTFIDEQDSAMIVDFDQVSYDESSGYIERREEDMHINIYELSPSKHKTYRLIKKLSKSGAEAYLEHQKPIEHISKNVYSYYDCQHPGSESEHGSTNFTINIKEGKYETDNEMLNQFIKRSQDFIYEEIQIRRQNAAKKFEQEKQAETAEKNAKFGNFLPNPDEVTRRVKLIEAAQEHRATEYIAGLLPEERPSFSQLFEPMQAGGKSQSFWNAMLDNYGSDDEKYVNEMKNILQLLNVSDEDLERINPLTRAGTAAAMLLEERRLGQESQNLKDDFMAWMSTHNRAKEAEPQMLNSDDKKQIESKPQKMLGTRSEMLSTEKNEGLVGFLPDEERLKLIEAAQEHRATEYIANIPPEKRPSFNQLFELMRVGDEFLSFWKALINSYRNDDECVNEIKNVLQLLNVSDEDLKSIDPRYNLGVAAGIVLKQRLLEREKQNDKNDFMAWMAQQNEKSK